MKKYLLAGSLGAALIFTTLASSSANADVLCVRNSVRANKKGAVATRSLLVTAPTECPKNTTQVLDTALFAGSSGSQGTTLPSGTTLRGAIGGWGTGNSLSWVTESLQAPAPRVISTNDIIIARTTRLQSYCEANYSGFSTCLSSTELAKDHTSCTGTFDLPTAPAGKVCIYLDVVFAGYGLEGQSLEAAANTASGSLYGFGLQWLNTNGFISKVKGSWAYTAP